MPRQASSSTSAADDEEGEFEQEQEHKNDGEQDDNQNTSERTSTKSRLHPAPRYYLPLKSTKQCWHLQGQNERSSAVAGPLGHVAGDVSPHLLTPAVASYSPHSASQCSTQACYQVRPPLRMPIHRSTARGPTHPPPDLALTLRTTQPTVSTLLWSWNHVNSLNPTLLHDLSAVSGPMLNPNRGAVHATLWRRGLSDELNRGACVLYCKSHRRP